MRTITIKAEDFEDDDDDDEKISLIDSGDEETTDEKIRADERGIDLNEMGKGGKLFMLS